MDTADVLADIDEVLEGYVDQDWSVSADAMRWSPEPLASPPTRQVHPYCRCMLTPVVAPTERALATARNLTEGTDPLALMMVGGPAAGDIVTVPNPGYPPVAYRFAATPPLEALFSSSHPVQIPRLMEFHDYVFDGAINADGSLRYRYLGQF